LDKKLAEAENNDGLAKMKGVFKEGIARNGIQLLVQILPLKEYFLGRTQPKRARLAKSLGQLFKEVFLNPMSFFESDSIDLEQVLPL